jgi:hypothetical protein
MVQLYINKDLLAVNPPIQTVFSKIILQTQILVELQVVPLPLDETQIQSLLVAILSTILQHLLPIFRFWQIVPQ